MGKLLCDTSAMAETLQTPSPILPPWPPQDPIPPPSPRETASLLPQTTVWDSVSGLEPQQKRYLENLSSKGVFWKCPDGSSPSISSSTFCLFHGGDVEADGNCLFTAAKKAMGLKIGVRDLRNRTVRRFLEEYGLDGGDQIDAAIRHLYSPDLKAGWGIHVVQEVKLLARKDEREALDRAIMEMVEIGMQREMAAESIYKERCIAVDDGPSWAKYMSISGSPEDEYDIITLQYTEEGLLTVDENREGHAAAFGDDIAIESLATEFKREIYVVQAHGSDAMVDEDNCVFFLPHRPRGQICELPFFLFMKGTGWCGAGADHYEPLIAHPAPFISQEKAAVVL
ncbi:uncharacterized protein LOC131239448 [Magnolia sinica]|uniref:uncharacterized protein LOC131239448 n=1 Tax=Magnolia sinica TaxID=86752 RepID=UPI00265A331E|nr:uncharacterized protein LOC131239448 [Magnolia sinica]